jgi:outer membrane protein assembly factor BamB
VKAKTRPVSRDYRYYKRVWRGAATICWGVAGWLGTVLAPAAMSAAAKNPVAPLIRPYEIAWTIDLDALDAVGAGPVWLAAGPSRLIVARSAGLVTGHALEDGHEVWRAAIAPEVAPVTGDGLAFIVGSGGQLRALDEATGEERWQGQISTRWLVPLWHAWVVVPSPVTPTWHAGWLLVASGTCVRAYRAIDGAQIWETDLGALVVRSIAIDGDRVFAVLADRRLVSLDIATGATRWSVPLESLPGALLAANDRIYFGAADGGYHCATQARGTECWVFRAKVEAVGAPVTNGEFIYFASLDNTVRALDQAGRMQWLVSLTTRPAGSVLLEGGHLVVPLTSGDLLLHLAKDRRSVGRLAALSPAGSPPGLVVHLDDVVGAGPQRLFRATAASSGARTVTAYRPGTLVIGPASAPRGTAVDLREPHRPPARR